MFDLDGVLRNTEPYHRMAYAQLARSLSGGAPPDAGEIAGKSNLQLYEALVARFGGPATAEELSQRHFRLVCQLLEEYRVGPMPGLEEALDALGELTGRTAREEIVQQIFSRFCVGK